MKLYKYKSLKNFEHVADIICNKKFYASKFSELNDPMEGLFYYELGTETKHLDDIKEGKSKLHICSFSKELGEPPLWAHYADGFRGICIEVNMEEESEDFELFDVKYKQDRIHFDNQQSYGIDKFTKETLKIKDESWINEKEVRALTSKEFIEKDMSITGIYLGLRISNIWKDVIAQLVSTDIPIFETKIGERNKIIKGQQINKVE